MYRHERNDSLVIMNRKDMEIIPLVLACFLLMLLVCIVWELQWDFPVFPQNSTNGFRVSDGDSGLVSGEWSNRVTVPATNPLSYKMTTIPWLSHTVDDPFLLAGGGSLQSLWDDRVRDDFLCGNLAEVIWVIANLNTCQSIQTTNPARYDVEPDGSYWKRLSRTNLSLVSGVVDYRNNERPANAHYLITQQSNPDVLCALFRVFIVQACSIS